MLKRSIALALAAVLCLSLCTAGISVRAEENKDPSSTQSVEKTLLDRLLECTDTGSMKTLYQENEAAVKAMSVADLNRLITHYNGLAAAEKLPTVELLKSTNPDTPSQKDASADSSQKGESGDSQKKGEPDESQKKDETDESRKKDNPDESRKKDETDESRKKDETDESQKKDETDESQKKDNPDESLKKDETDGETVGTEAEAAPEVTPEEHYSAMMALESLEAVNAYADSMDEAAARAFIQYMEENSELKLALLDRIHALTPPPVTVPFTAVASLKDPVYVPPIVQTFGIMPYNDSEGTEGLHIAKNVTPTDQPGTYTVSLEAYTTGAVSTQVESYPVDIVLLLDYSDSMGRGIEGAASRKDAMIEAVNHFIDEVAREYSSENNHRISIVRFAGSVLSTGSWTTLEQKNVKALKDSLKKGTSSKTNHGAAMAAAESLIESSKDLTGSRRKVVILFTDGAPEVSGDMNFSVDTANAAIASAKRMKDAMVTVYTVGIMDGAKANQLYDDSKNSGCHGNVGEYWDDNKTGPASNRFLNYASSNFLSAENLGLERATVKTSGSKWGSNKKDVFKITQNYTRDDTGYYLVADSAKGLDEIFTGISSQIGKPTVSLGTDTLILDGVTQYFDISSDVTVQQIPCERYEAATGMVTWGEAEAVTGIHASSEDNQVKVSGFDFDRNFVAEKGRWEDDASQDGDFHGRKLQITFEITRKSGFLGGNKVPTNTPDSGIYTSGSALDLFDYRQVDVPVYPLTVTGLEGYVYAGGIADAEKLASGISLKCGEIPLDLTAGNFGLEPWQNEFVRLEFSADPLVQDPLMQDTVFRSDCRLTPTKTGTNGVQTIQATAAVRVITPRITWQDSRLAGELPDYMTDNYISTEWLWGDTPDSQIADLQSKLLESAVQAPQLTFRFDTAPAAFTQDTPVKVTVLREDVDITVCTDFAHEDCRLVSSCPWGEPGFQDCQFIVHPGTFNLVITKSAPNGVNDAGDTFIFTVSNGTGVSLTVSLKAGQSVTIQNLPAGDYTVTENTGWSTGYTASPSSVRLDADSIKNGSAAITFTNIRQDVPLTGSAEIKNNFKPVSVPIK